MLHGGWCKPLVACSQAEIRAACTMTPRPCSVSACIHSAGSGAAVKGLGGTPGSCDGRTAESAMHEPLPQKAYRALQRHDSRLRRAAGMHGATTADARQAPADLRREVPRLRCAAGMHAAAPAWQASAALPCQRACLQGTAAMHTTAHAPHAHATAAVGMHSGPCAC